MQARMERGGRNRAATRNALFGLALGWLLLAPVAASMSPSAPTPQALDPWFVHPAGHFRIQPPAGWIVEPNVTISGGIVDLILRGAPSRGQGPEGGVIAIASESRSSLGSARSI